MLIEGQKINTEMDRKTEREIDKEQHTLVKPTDQERHN